MPGKVRGRCLPASARPAVSQTRLGQPYSRPGAADYFESGVAEKTFLAMLAGKGGGKEF